MKLITDNNMRAVSVITASSEAAGFSVANLLKYDPDLIWKAASFSANVRITLDLGSPGALDHIWLNNANFLSAVIEANASNSWASPAVSVPVTLAEDDIGVIKGFFDLSATPYRYVSVVVPVQTLVSGTLPQLGNIIIGNSVYLYASTWEPTVQEEMNAWQPDGGGYVEESKGKARHIFSTSMLGITKAELDAAPLKGWEVAIVNTELGSVADSYLVYRPKGMRIRVFSQINCEVEYVMRELV